MSAVPKLRFSEFDGEWEPVSSGDFYEFRNGLNYTKGMSGEEIKTLGVSDFQSNSYFNNFEKLPSVRVAGTISSKDTLADDDLVFVRSNGNKDLIGRCMFIRGVDRKASFSGFIIRGRICQNGLDALFGASLFKSSKFRTYLSVMGGGTNISNLSQAILSDFTFSIPSLPEQQKIASFLSSVDKKIDLLRQKKDALELYKKGLMQKIFSQEIRFKQDDGSDFPDWEEVYADEILKTVSNKNHDGTEKIVSISQTGGAVYRDQNGIDIIASEESVKNYKIIEPGDFVISLRSFQGGIEYSEIRGICSPAYTIMKPTVDLDTSFFRTFFKTGDFIKRLSLTVVGIRDGKQISFGAFSTIPLPFPSVPEQKKIASFLSKIDVKIQKTSSQIEQMETFKTGLLQQMFV